jgi:uncharacterized protein (DUF1697 family)
MSTRFSPDSEPGEPTTRVVALLRGINVGGHRKVPMAELRALAEGLGAREVRTYIASGNLVCASPLEPPELARALERAIAAYFGFEVDVVTRSAGRWAEYAQGHPFGDVPDEALKFVHLCVARDAAAPDAAARLERYLGDGERIVLLEDAVWVDYASGVARSKLTPARLDAAMGSPVTARNWKTVAHLAHMLGVEAGAA